MHYFTPPTLPPSLGTTPHPLVEHILLSHTPSYPRGGGGGGGGPVSPLGWRVTLRSVQVGERTDAGPRRVNGVIPALDWRSLTSLGKGGHYLQTTILANNKTGSQYRDISVPHRLC